MANMIEATGENFILTFVKDGLAYPVVLSDEQKEAFNMIINFIPGVINVGKDPIGKVMTLSEIRKMKEGCC